MLVLSRRKDETVRIGEDVIVFVLGFYGDQVRLGFVAPADVIIHRGEVFDRIKAGEPGADPRRKDES